MNESMEMKWNELMAIVEDYIKSLSFKNSRLEESGRYSLVGGGKRLRPVLALAAAEAVWKSQGMLNLSFHAALPAAAALELIHTYSLIHDDLPAMDNDDYRRGKPASHIKYGEAQAILTGDALLTYAFQLLSGPSPLPATDQLRIIAEVAEAAGEAGMVGGQLADMEGEGKNLNLGEIEDIHRLKTGALLKAAVRMGAIAAGGSEEQIKALTKYGESLGLAFQIKDDMLDIESDSETLGKPAGSDIKLQKATYPSLLGLDGARAHLEEKIREAKDAIETLGEHGDFLSYITDYVGRRRH